MNGTYREIEGRILTFRARTGGDYASVWISHERWSLLPEPFRVAAMGDCFHRRQTAAGSIAGVPVRLIDVLPPEIPAQEARERAWAERGHRAAPQ